MNERAKTILDFWFTQSTMEDWFKKDDIYDQKIKKLFLEISKKQLTMNMMNGKILQKSV
jgi:uncharacterized protein (DUF924 family)